MYLFYLDCFFTDPYLMSLMTSLEQTLYDRSVVSSIHVRHDTWSLILDDFRQTDPDQIFVSHYTLYLLWADVSINTHILRQVGVLAQLDVDQFTHRQTNKHTYIHTYIQTRGQLYIQKKT